MGSRNLPGPAAVPLVGPLGNAIRFSRDVVGHAGALFGEFGPLVALAGGDLREKPALARWVLVQGADLYREVATRTDDFHKPPLNKQLSPTGDHLTERQKALKRWGAGLFGLNGEAHGEQRRIMMPAFHKSHVETYRSDIVAITEEEFQHWELGSVMDIRRRLQQLTLRIITCCLLGQNAGTGAGSLADLNQRALSLLISPGVFLLPFDVPGFPYRQLLDVVQETDRAAHRVIEQKRRGGMDNDLLSMLLKAQMNDAAIFSDDDIVEHTVVIFIAGNETTSNALMWTLLLLSQHPRVAADLLDELEGRLHGAAPTIDQLTELPFLDAVIQESLRVLPPVPLNARVVAHDTQLRGYELPAGTQLLISLFHTQRSPEVFARPNAFDPQRWQTSKPGPYEFAPFGTGLRTCIGAAFAMTELKIMLAMMVQRFRLELLPGTRVNRSARITLSAKGGLPLKVNAQDRQFSRGAGGMLGNVRQMLDLSQPVR